MAGLPVVLIGVADTGVLAIQRLFFGQGLADRPALVLAVLRASSSAFRCSRGT